MLQIKEYDVIKTKDGRVGTVLLLHHFPKLSYEVAFDDKPGETSAVGPESVQEIIRQAEE
jgi:hypothetical protein